MGLGWAGGGLGAPWSHVTPRNFCVAGVALGDIHLHFAWQAWHLVTFTFILRGRRGTSWHFGTRNSCAHRLCHTTLSHSIFHIPSFAHSFVTHHLCHTPSLPIFVTNYLSHTIFVTHHVSHTTLSHTIFPHTIFVTHHLSHTTLSHTLSHTTLSHHNFVTHHLSHTSFTHTFVTQLSHTPSLSHTIIHKPLCHTPSFPIFVTNFL